MRTLYLVEACNRCPLKHPFRICHSSYRPLRPLMLMPRSPTSLLTGRAPCRPPSRLPEHLFAHTPSEGQSTHEYQCLLKVQGWASWITWQDVFCISYELVNQQSATVASIARPITATQAMQGQPCFGAPQCPQGSGPTIKNKFIIPAGSQFADNTKKNKNNESWLCHRGTLSWTIMPMPPPNPMMVPHPP